MNQNELRKLIRDRVRTGLLPSAVGSTTFGGRGRDGACDCCGKRIARHEMEYQVEFTPPARGSRNVFVAHIECHWIWWEESGSLGEPSATPHAVSPVWNALQESTGRGGSLS
jgi:hypothetical protein